MVTVTVWFFLSFSLHLWFYWLVAFSFHHLPIVSPTNQPTSQPFYRYLLYCSPFVCNHVSKPSIVGKSYYVEQSTPHKHLSSRVTMTIFFFGIIISIIYLFGPKSLHTLYGIEFVLYTFSFFLSFSHCFATTCPHGIIALSIFFPMCLCEWLNLSPSRLKSIASLSSLYGSSSFFCHFKF